MLKSFFNQVSILQKVEMTKIIRSYHKFIKVKILPDLSAQILEHYRYDEFMIISLHSYLLRYLTQEKWIPIFWMPILDILDFQQPGMMKIMRTVQAIF